MPSSSLPARSPGKPEGSSRRKQRQGDEQIGVLKHIVVKATKVIITTG